MSKKPICKECGNYMDQCQCKELTYGEAKKPIHGISKKDFCETCEFNRNCNMQSAWKEVVFVGMECCEGENWEKYNSPFSCNKHREKG